MQVAPFQKINVKIVQGKESLEKIVHRVQGQRYAQVASSYLVGQSAGISFRKLTRESQNRPRGSFAATSRFDEFSRDRPWMQTKTGACLTDTLKSSLLLLLNSLTSHQSEPELCVAYWRLGLFTIKQPVISSNHSLTNSRLGLEFFNDFRY